LGICLEKSWYFSSSLSSEEKSGENLKSLKRQRVSFFVAKILFSELNNFLLNSRHKEKGVQILDYSKINDANKELCLLKLPKEVKLKD